MSKILNRKKLFLFRIVKPILLVFVGFVRLFDYRLAKKANRSISVCLWHTYRVGDSVMFSDVCAAVSNGVPDTLVIVVNSLGHKILKYSFPNVKFIVLDTPWVDGYTISNAVSLYRGVRALRRLYPLKIIELQGDGRNHFVACLASPQALISFGGGGGEGFCTDTVPSYFSEHLLDANRRLIKHVFPFAEFGGPRLTRRTGFFPLESGVRRCGMSLGASKKSKLVNPELFCKALAMSAHGKDIDEFVIFSTEPSGLVNEQVIQAGIENDFGCTCWIVCLDLEELLTAMSELYFFIGVDSGLAHIASALSVPTDIVFTDATKPEIHTPGHWGIGVYLTEGLR